MSELAGNLWRLYQEQLALRPEDAYLRQHCKPGFLTGTLRVFEFYEPYLPGEGRILDWGCRHAPDACLIHALRPDLTIDACDVCDPADYRLFYQYAGLTYEQLEDPVRLPYPDAAFDAVIASGVLEHVPMDYESLKELHRVIRPDGRLIVTYLPNRASSEEWDLRRRNLAHHERLYSRSKLRRMLLHTGFMPLVAGYQTQLDLLPAGNRGVRSLRLFGLHRLASCLCAVAARTAYL